MANEAIAKSHILADLGVQFIEQPLPAHASHNECRSVFAASALPIFADESCRTEADVETCAEFFHGVNMKLSKCGGITPAARLLGRARSLGLQTMIGCMLESSVGISAAAQLLPLVDYADLDGACLLSADPASGVAITAGRVGRPRQAGCGSSLTDAIE
jgi:L-alanine-DL-glutamate epimerase-like enolase superfamily enzyme